MDDSRTNTLTNYREVVMYGGTFGPGAAARVIRDDLLNLSADAAGELAIHDEHLISAAVSDPEEQIAKGLLDDHADKPIAHWWWHLGAMRAGTYSLALLPDHLRAAYNEARDDALTG